jgi:hypothetical protein
MGKKYLNSFTQMKQFKITLSGHFSTLGITLVWLIIFSIASAFIYFIELDKIFIYFTWGFFIVMNIPVLLIHINYWIVDKNKVIQFNFDNQTIIQRVGKNVCTYSFKDVKCVVLTENSCFDKSAYHNTFNTRTPWSEYFYYQIDLINNEKIILTSLSIKQTEFLLEVNKIRYEGFQATN